MNKIFLAMLMILAFGCRKTSQDQTPDLPGMYKMFLTTSGDIKYDSVAGIELYKMYTKDYFIYAATHDSTASFAVGTYTNEGSKLTEHVIFGTYDTTILPSYSYVFNSEKTSQGFSQSLKDAGLLQGKFPLQRAEYKHIGNGTECLMDGAWKLLASYAVQNKDTVWDNYINYKLCLDGYVIWGAVTQDSVKKKNKTYIGVDTFEMKGSKGKEFCINSNYFQNKGTTFDLDVEFKGEDEFKQTILDSTTGIKYVEIYQRLNKLTIK